MKMSYHWLYLVKLTQCPTLWHCFLLKACDFARTQLMQFWAMFCKPVIRLIPSIGSLVTKLLCASKNMSLRWWENNVGDCGWCVSASSARYPPLLCFRDKVKNKERRERLTGGRQTAAKWNKRVDMSHSLSLSLSKSKQEKRKEKRKKRVDMGHSL